MTERVERITQKIRSVKQYPICVEKAQIIKDSFEKNDGYPQIIRRS